MGEHRGGVASGGDPFMLSDTADTDGFRSYAAGDSGRFFDGFGTIGIRIEGSQVRCRVATGRAQSNLSDNVHGGFIMAFVDQAMFCALVSIDRLPPGGAVTLQAGVNFIGAAHAGRPVDALVEVVGETGRMLFVRGLLEQDGRTIGSFDGTLRKIRGAAAA